MAWVIGAADGRTGGDEQVGRRRAYVYFNLSRLKLETLARASNIRKACPRILSCETT